MDGSQLKEKLTKKAQQLGIDKIGFASADPFLELKERLREQQERGFSSGFEEKDIELRTHPEKLMPMVKTIIAIAIAYPAKLSNPPKSTHGNYRGIFCRASWGTDYHQVLKQKLDDLAVYLHSLIPNATIQSMVDTGALSDRAVAERAGIGWSGKNTSIITEEFGSWVYLGEMLVDVYIPPDEPIEDGCGECTLCMTACPTGALVEPGRLDAQSCIAYLTQTKAMIPEKYRDKIGNRLYGCDTCQTVCPKNRKRYFDHQQALKPDGEKVKPLLKPLLKLSNRQFKEQYGSMSGSWRGKNPIQRNAIIALAHFKDKSAIPQLASMLQQDARPMIRGMIAWALGKIGGEEAEQSLQKAMKAEKDEMVIKEIQLAILKLKNRK
ncbi:tRNA epoxyqueuosine(34) reductase QueG [Shimazuella sp. AN120528]|uniref:tRNA epoxyqueuosine(34) reductase QueG n=1 Tax=Shimazuella soli TaxID=1892854 RepID=UPI001F114FA5|nr:tRNA epoxyqueuosine(34) reductase QueG [Shimazuella soli]MCH5585737.1 tRNA epoxyqueuosine(34) reductase QueG [Shimazuella soli]